MKETSVSEYILTKMDAINLLDKCELAYTREEWDIINNLIGKGTMCVQVKIMEIDDDE